MMMQFLSHLIMWHNIVKLGDEPLKFYTIYVGLNHLSGTIHITHEDTQNDPNEQN